MPHPSGHAQPPAKLVKLAIWGQAGLMDHQLSSCSAPDFDGWASQRLSPTLEDDQQPMTHALPPASTSLLELPLPEHADVERIVAAVEYLRTQLDQADAHLAELARRIADEALAYWDELDDAYEQVLYEKHCKPLQHGESALGYDFYTSLETLHLTLSLFGMNHLRWRAPVLRLSEQYERARVLRDRLAGLAGNSVESVRRMRVGLIRHMR